MFDVGVFGSPFISNGSSLVELVNGEDRLLFSVNFDERGDAAGTLWGVIPCE